MSTNGSRSGAVQAPLRSAAWWGKRDRDGFIHRSWMRSEGFAPDVFDGRPVIGICNSWSELTSCNVHLRRVAESVKRGVWEAGGWPLEFPTISLGETYMRPTTMLFRNLMSMDVEESIRANPIDGVVLLSGCDKTTPAQLMGAASVDLPTIMVTGGPMLNGKYRGQDIGSGTMVWQFSEEVRAGRMSWPDFFEAEACQSRSNGHCMTMGTASTMASMAEALGIAPTGNAAIPAVDSRRYALAQLAGRRIVEMVREDLRMSKILTRQAFENAIRVNAAIGGSTNAVVHLLAIAGRIGVPLELDDFDRLGHDLPLLVDLQPSGRFLMEDFYYAGGLPVVVRELMMEANMFDFLNTILGFYANCGMAWIVVVASDIAINKFVLKLSPMKPEFRRGMLYAFNPVGFGSMLIAAGLSVIAFFGGLGEALRPYSPLVAIVLGLVLPPIFAIATKGKYYLRRTDDGIDLPMYDEHGNPSDAHLLCQKCHHEYERPDMLASAAGGYICSLCLATDKTGEHVLPAQ